MIEFDLEMNKNLINFKINDKNVVNELEVSFKRKNKIFTNNIYIIMSESMEENIKKNTIFFRRYILRNASK